MNSRSVRELLNDWLARDEQAARELFERYARRLAGLAERHLSRKLAARVDGDDIVQSVFRTFFERSARGEFHIRDSGDLWQLLVTITLMKVRMEGRRHTATRRDVSAEASGPAEEWLAEAIAREPRPDDAAALVDQVEAVLKGLPAAYSQILTMRLEGRTRTEIARQLEVSRQTVHRALGVMQDRLVRLSAADAEP